MYQRISSWVGHEDRKAPKVSETVAHSENSRTCHGQSTQVPIRVRFEQGIYPDESNDCFSHVHHPKSLVNECKLTISHGHTPSIALYQLLLPMVPHWAGTPANIQSYRCPHQTCEHHMVCELNHVNP